MINEKATLNSKSSSMDVIKIDKFKSLTGVKNNFLAQSAMKVLGLNKVNAIYNQSYHTDASIFLEQVKSNLELEIEFDPADLKNIPKEGPFITISNHPFGGIDGILLLELLLKVRPDFKVLGNYLLSNIEPIQDQIIQVDPFHPKDQINLSGIKQALIHISTNHPIGIFPAGEVSSWSGLRKGIIDKPWKKSIIKFIKRCEVPIIPIYFHGSNSVVFNGLGVIHPFLRTLQLPREAIKQGRGPIQIKIGKPISVKRQSKFTSNTQLGAFLRSKTYILGTGLKSKLFFKKKFFLKKPKSIIHPTPHQLIIYDLVQIPKEDKLFSVGPFDCFCTTIENIPNIIREIGRLREITFRDVGEGTNKELDIDQYDIYYKHLFVWEREKQKIVGAYRVGNGKQIMAEYGKAGFYICSLFKTRPELNPLLASSMELGRSFIVPEFQRSASALFMLWKGILYYTINNKECDYLIGPVSISGRYNKNSKMLIANYIIEHHFDEQLAEFVKPRKRVRFTRLNNKTNFNALNSETLEELDRVIEAIEPGKVKLPILLKKYLKQKAKIIGFNRDPQFNNALDGFLVLKLSDLNIEFVKGLSQDFDDAEVLSRFSPN